MSWFRATEICENENCQDQTSQKRHPVICRYFYRNQRCKFGDCCAFRHKVHNSCESIKSLQEIVRKLEKEKENIKKINEALSSKFKHVKVTSLFEDMPFLQLR